jgi:hypothetical protein
MNLERQYRSGRLFGELGDKIEVMVRRVHADSIVAPLSAGRAICS